MRQTMQHAENAGQHGIYDPLRKEWATPIPCAQPFTVEASNAARLSYADAVNRARNLCSMERPWLVIQPLTVERCAICGGEFVA